MTRQQFLKKLASQWEADGAMSETMFLEDLLDDAACLGISGASDVYMTYLQELRTN